eukprot:scaffold584_cov338-Pavlova_lutheri.AAC.33
MDVPPLHHPTLPPFHARLRWKARDANLVRPLRSTRPLFSRDWNRPLSTSAWMDGALDQYTWIMKPTALSAKAVHEKPDLDDRSSACVKGRGIIASQETCGIRTHDGRMHVHEPEAR